MAQFPSTPREVRQAAGYTRRRDLKAFKALEMFNVGSQTPVRLDELFHADRAPTRKAFLGFFGDMLKRGAV